MIKALQDKLAGLMAQSEEIRLRHAGKSTTMTGQEETEWENVLNEADSVKKQIEILGREDSLKTFASRTGNALPMGGGGHVDDKGVEIEVTETKSDKDTQRHLFRKFLKGAGALTSADTDQYNQISVEHALKSMPDTTPAIRSAAIKAYQGDNASGGGYLITPQELANEILTLMKDLCFIRTLARKFTMPFADTLGIPALDTDPSDSDWTSELGTGNEETTMAFGKRELRPQALAKRIKESKKLLRQIPNLEEFVLDRLGYKMGITEEKAFLAGSGAGQPLGVFTLSGDGSGITATRDVVAANAASIVADDLINVQFALKNQYRKGAQWILNRTVLKAVRKLKDSNNNYIWATALGAGNGVPGRAINVA